MFVQKFIQLGLQHLKHSALEEIYLQTRIDITKPRVIKATVNERCNYKCKYCSFWRLEQYQDEMSIEEWQQALLSLKSLVGWYVIQFAGGEPFLKPRFIDLVEFCHREGIAWSVITNGSVLAHPKTVEKIVMAEPINLDISVDSASAEIHDYVRGVPNSLRNITQGIKNLREIQKAQGLNFPIRIKPTVHKLNCNVLPELVDWTQKVGATTIDFNVLKPWTEEAKNELWIREEKDIIALKKSIDRLIIMKQEGAPIETSELKLESFVDSFLGKTLSYGVLPCRLSLRDYHIRANGDIRLCGLYEPLGNVRQNTAHEIWYGDRAKKLRSEMISCKLLGKSGCANICMGSHVPLKHQVKRGLMLLNRSNSIKESHSKN